MKKAAWLFSKRLIFRRLYSAIGCTYLLESHTACNSKCCQNRRRYRSDDLRNEFCSFFLCHNVVILVVNTCLSFRPFPLIVMSTKRSAWRHLMNAPKGASGKPQRFLDSARNDKEGMKGRESEGANAPTLNRPRLGHRRPVEESDRHHSMAGCSQGPRCHHRRRW